MTSKSAESTTEPESKEENLTSFQQGQIAELAFEFLAQKAGYALKYSGDQHTKFIIPFEKRHCPRSGELSIRYNEEPDVELYDLRQLNVDHQGSCVSLISGEKPKARIEVKWTSKSRKNFHALPKNANTIAVLHPKGILIRPLTEKDRDGEHWRYEFEHVSDNVEFDFGELQGFKMIDEPDLENYISCVYRFAMSAKAIAIKARAKS